jgi:hypothetical protein
VCQHHKEETVTSLIKSLKVNERGKNYDYWLSWVSFRSGQIFFAMKNAELARVSNYHTSPTGSIMLLVHLLMNAEKLHHKVPIHFSSIQDYLGIASLRVKLPQDT